MPGMMMRTMANILMKVKVTWVREATVTLQQLTTTTNAVTQSKKKSSRAQTSRRVDKQSRLECLEPLTHSEDADQSDEQHGCSARHEERLHHVLPKGQGQVGRHSRPGGKKNRACACNTLQFDPGVTVNRTWGESKQPDEHEFNPEAQKARQRSQCLQ